MEPIDIRSDTFTVPTEAMRKAIANAKVGDDVFGEDPTVNELQEYAAGLLGKEAALYVASGVMANQTALAAITNTGEEVILDADAHIFYYEAASPSIISRVQLRCIKSEDGRIPEDEIEASIRPSDDHFPPTSAVCLENTHNRHGGTILPLKYIEAIKSIVEKHKLKFHCDGARLWEACAATGISPAEYANPFDTVSVCLSKGLGAPVGSLVAGSAETIAKAHRWRKILGGGMRQAGIIAAAGLHALQNHLSLLPQSHENAKKFVRILAESGLVSIDTERAQTNIVVFNTPESIDAATVQEECSRRGVLLLALGKNMMRAVFHFQIDATQAKTAAEIVRDVIFELKNND